MFTGMKNFQRISVRKSTVMREYGINAGWKAVLWFVKGTRDNNSVMVSDVMSGGEEKTHHDWQQSESEAAYWIDKLCPVDGLVCDPFLGGGMDWRKHHAPNVEKNLSFSF